MDLCIIGMCRSKKLVCPSCWNVDVVFSVLLVLGSGLVFVVLFISLTIFMLFTL